MSVPQLVVIDSATFLLWILSPLSLFVPPSTGTPAVTSRHMKEDNMLTIVGFIDEAVVIAQDVKKSTGGQ